MAIILPVFVYGCETWSLALREEHRLRLFENKVLRGIFGPKGDEVTEGWWKLLNEELRNLYSSPSIMNDQVMEDGMGRACSMNGRTYRLLVGKPEGKRSLGRPTYRWVDNMMVVWCDAI
jgi:hypothetical protein